jgi:hypothetical protein
MEDNSMISAPFIVFSLPRSRSAWLTHFLSYPPKRVGHDVIVYCDHVSDFIRLYSEGMDGACETATVLGHRLIRHLMPTVKFAVVRRPLAEVVASLARMDLTAPLGELEARDAMLDQVEALPGTLSLQYAELDSPDFCRRLFEFCHGGEPEFEIEWWAQCSRFNIQVEMGKQVVLLQERKNALSGLRAEMMKLSQELPCHDLH